MEETLEPGGVTVAVAGADLNEGVDAVIMPHSAKSDGPLKVG